MTETMLQTKNLKFSYDGKNYLDFPDINCQRGEQWLLLGQSGSGKTTLLHLLGGLRKPRQGEIMINGENTNQLSSTALDQFRGKNIGIVFQKPYFVRALTVEENLMLAQELAGQDIDKDYIFKLLNQLNVGHKFKSKTENLSEGEKQRVSIARALVNRPTVILADEPTSALDDKNCHEVIRLLEQQSKEANATLLIVTHDGRLKELIKNQIEL
ncbi:ATP-binding cassette domain-containing protein [Saprospiraceae bacterium]|nr:ATP-binding cassette domain-containing protein [Saprospiraceae bacterium]